MNVICKIFDHSYCVSKGTIFCIRYFHIPESYIKYISIKPPTKLISKSMEKVTIKIELDKDDISAIMKLVNHKLTDEQWDKMKGKECIVCDEDMEGQAVRLKLAFSSIAIGKLLKDK